MAELAALGAAASSIDLFVLATRIFQRYRDYMDAGHRVPRNLQCTANQLPYLRESLKKHAEGEQAALAAGDTPAVAFLLQECQQYLTKLDEFISELIPAASDGRLEKVKKAIKSVRKDDELKQIQAELSHQISTLSYGSSVTIMSRLATHRCVGAVPSPQSHIENAPLRATYGFPTVTKVAKFIGRREMVDNIAQKLLAPSPERVVVILQGIGGQGKTQIALEVSNRQDIRHHFKPIVWINSTSEDSTSQAFEGFAAQMAQKGSVFEGSQAKIDYVKERLEDHNRPSLMVFDSYDDLFINRRALQSYYPDDSKHVILITSRHEDSLNLGEGILVQGMPVNEAVSLLLHRSQLGHISSVQKEAEAIVSHLGYLALAIAQAGAYISMKKIPLCDFLDHYNKRTTAVLKQTPEVWEYGLSVFTTWEMSIEYFSKNRPTNENLSESVPEMLLFCVILHHDVVNEQFLSHLLTHAGTFPTWTEPFTSGDQWDPAKFQDTIAKLGRLSLLQILRNKSGHYEFSIHPLIADWLRLNNQPVRLIESIESAMRIVANFIKSKKGREMTFEVRREVRIYVWACLDNLRDLEGALEDKDLQTDSIMDSKFVFAKYMIPDSQLSNGTRLFEEVIPIWRRRYGNNHPKTVAASKELIRGYITLKRYDEAEQVVRVLLTAPDQSLSCALADCFSAQERYEEATQTYEALLPRLQSELGACDQLTVSCMNNMACNYQSSAQSVHKDTNYTYAFSNDNAKAEKLWLAIIANTDSCTTSPSKEGFDEEVAAALADVYSNLGCLYHDRGLRHQELNTSGTANFLQAEEMHRKALAAHEALYGADTARVLTISHNLAVSLNLADNFEESEIYYQRTLDGYEQLYGPDSERTVRICHCYGHVLASQYKLLEGVHLHTRSYHGLEAAFGAGDESTLSVFDCLIDLYKSINNQLEIEKLYRHALDARTAALGQSHKVTLDTAADLGDLYMNQDRHQDAERLLRRAVDVYSVDHPFDGPSWTDSRMLDSMYNLAHAYYFQRKLDSAERYFGLLLGYVEARDGMHGVHTVDMAQCVAKVFEAQGDTAKAEELHEKYEEGYEKVLTGAHKDEWEMVENVAQMTVSDADGA